MALIFSIASRKYLSAAFQLKHSYKTWVDISETILLILFFQVNIAKMHEDGWWRQVISSGRFNLEEDATL